MESNRTLVVRTSGPDETRSVGIAFARSLPAGSTLSLEGPLGAGKTVLVRGLCEGWGVVDDVTSPSYTLQNEYRTADGQRVLHLDCFRLGGPGELEDLGLEDQRDPDTMVVVEWGDRGLAALPADTIRVKVEPDSAGKETDRRISIRVPDGVEITGIEVGPVFEADPEGPKE